MIYFRTTSRRNMSLLHTGHLATTLPVVSSGANWYNKVYAGHSLSCPSISATHRSVRSEPSQFGHYAEIQNPRSSWVTEMGKRPDCS